MATTQDIHAPTLGAQGEPCANCGAPLASDQRYCLECGARRADARIPFRDILASQGGPTAVPVVRYGEGHKQPGGITFLVGLLCLLLALGVGVLIGRSGDDSPTAAAPAPAPQVISVGGAAPAATSTPTTASPTSTSPSSPEPAHSGASSNSSAHSKATNKSVQDLDKSSGSDYEKKSKNLPKEVGTGGKPPPKDNKPAGGGSDFETIG
jgi:hypothetical protein